ncbi:MAG TPA: VWA domain-containing protein [Desertimonas sp.]|nr:VWA domain-containing protein [Desertimonas sp.]HET9666334.1 VWA domain-containing protein [Desertimonas sp.]
MTFLEPQRLWLLVVVGALAVAYVAVLRWRRAATLRFTTVDLLDELVPRRPQWRRHVVAGLQLLGLSAGVIAVARPITTTTERTASEGRIVVALDTSLSMEATDIAPNRLAAAQQAATDFVGQVADDVEIGLVSFSGSVAVEVPPTLDRTALDTAIAELQLDDATAIGDALIVSTNLLVQLQERAADGTVTDGADVVPGAIVLLTDGETTFGASTEEGAEVAAAVGVPVFTIAFGTADGVIIDPDTGDAVAVPVKPEPLRAAAETTGGQAYEAATPTELADAYQRIEAVLGDTLGEAVEVVTERTWVWAAAALGTLAIAWALSLWWLRGLV